MESRFIRVVLLAVVASACAASSTSVPVPATILVVPDSVTLRSGQTIQLVATVLDGSGSQITGVAVTFTSVNAAVASVTPGGVVTAGVSGATTVVATAGPASTTVPVVVRPLPATTIVASPAVGGCPHGIAVASTGVGYVTQVCVGSASRFQMSPPSPTGNLEVGSTPAHVALAPGGATAYIVNQYGRRLTIVNTETNIITDTVPLGHEGYNVAVAPNGARVYVTTGDGWVMEVNVVTRAIVDSVQVGAGANGLAFHPTAPRLFVSSVLTGTVAAINTTSLTVERTYTVGGMPQRIAVAPSGTTLYAANEITGIDFLNLTSGAVTSTPLAPPGSGVAIGLALSLDGYYAYVGMANGGKVEVVDVADRTVLTTISTGGDPRNIAIAPGGGIVIANQAGWIDFVQ